MKGRPGSVARLVALVVVAVAMSACNQKPIMGPVLVIEPDAASAHQIGHFEATNRTLVANAGESGFLHFGPYAELPPGAYEARFVVSSSAAATDVGRVEINAFEPNKAQNVLASLPIPRDVDQRRLTLPFVVPAGVKLEFRVFSDGAGTMTLHRIEIIKQ